MKNVLLRTDVYKMDHMVQACPGTTKFYSYLTARNDREFDRVVFFGLNYYLREYLSKPITAEMGDEFLMTRREITGSHSTEVENKIRALCKLGYWPLEIKAVREGSVVPVQNVLMTITNTLPEFYWTVGFVESLLLKVWYPCTVATHSNQYRRLVDEMFAKTVDDTDAFLRDYMVHDFGYRGDSSEEGAAISGAAHLLNFIGSDTVPAGPFLHEYYRVEPGTITMQSVPASEHSVMCSFGRDDELAAFEHMLKTYPTGIVSIVSDTFDIYRVLTEFAEKLKPTILARDGKVVFRPDSGNPEHIICGNPEAPEGSNEWLGAIRLLDRMFGSTVNSKGYKALNPKVGLIYGDGMYFERYERTLRRLAAMGYAASNLVIGVGGILRNHSRDSLGFAIKATYVEVNGQPREIEKDPVTDRKKKSHKGLLCLTRDEAGRFKTQDQVTAAAAQEGELRTVFINGEAKRPSRLSSMRQRAAVGLR